MIYTLASKSEASRKEKETDGREERISGDEERREKELSFRSSSESRLARPFLFAEPITAQPNLT